jgi:4-amino-4-deoxy-L-arabinose transferase-like glycosyltransferase
MVEAGKDTRLLLIVSFLTVSLFAVSNLPWTLDDYDQAKQAFVSYQMIGQQRWLYQTTPTEGKEARGGRHSSYHISTKPPAVAWVSAALYAVTRSWDFAWRFPSFLAAVGLAVLIFRAARAFGDLAGLIALAAFGLNLLSVRLATLVRTDMPLALVTFAVGLLMFEKIRTRIPWTTRDRTTLFVLLMAAMFIKGPIVWAFVLPPLVVYQLRRRWRPDFPDAWSGWIPWVASFAIFCLWVIFGIRFIDGFYEDVVLNEFAGRFHEGIHRSQPLLFYIPHLLQKFAPWSLLIIGLLVIALRKTKTTTGIWSAKLSPEMFWLIVWTVGGIALMSLIPSKRVDRIFPAIPPLCLLLAAQIRAMTAAGSSTGIRRIALLAIVFSAIFTGVYSAMRVIHGYRDDRDALVKFGRDVRRIAAAEHLRIEVLPARDEGLLLYLQRPRFFTLNLNGKLCAGCDYGFDGLVVPLDEEPWDSNKSQYRLTVEKKGDPPTSYGFLAPPPHR